MDGPTALLSVGGSRQSAFIVESCLGYKLSISTLVLQSCSKVTNHAASETLWSELFMATCWDLEVTQTGSPRWLMIQTSYKTTLCKLSQTHIHRHTRAFWGVSCLHVCIWLQSAMLIIACIARWDSEAIQTHSSEWLLTQTSRNTILCKWSQTRMHNHSLRFLTCTPIHIATCVHTYMCIYIYICIYI